MKKIVSILLMATMLLTLFAIAPLSADAASPTTYVYSKTMDIKFYTSTGAVGTFHAAVPTLKNITGPDVSSIQTSLNDIYEYEADRADYLYKKKVRFTPKVAYTAYLSGNILSIAVSINNHDMDVDSRYSYAINVKTGKEVSNSELLKSFGLTENQAKSLITSAIQKDLETGKSAAQKYYSTYGYQFYQKVIDQMANPKAIHYFLDENGSLMACYYDYWEWDNQFVGYSLFAKIKNKSASTSTTSTAYPKVTTLQNVNGGVKIAWTKVSGAKKYRLFYKTASGWKRFGTDGTATSCTINSLKSGTKYTFTVRGINSSGKYQGTYYKNGYSITYIAAPAAPSLTNKKNGIQIGWKKVTGAAKYRIFRKTGSGGWKKLVDTTSTSYLDKSAKKNYTYTYTVRCISKDGKKFTSGYNTRGRSIGCTRKG